MEVMEAREAVDAADFHTLQSLQEDYKRDENKCVPQEDFPTELSLHRSPTRGCTNLLAVFPAKPESAQVEHFKF